MLYREMKLTRLLGLIAVAVAANGTALAQTGPTDPDVAETLRDAPCAECEEACVKPEPQSDAPSAVMRARNLDNDCTGDDATGCTNRAVDAYIKFDGIDGESKRASVPAGTCMSAGRVVRCPDADTTYDKASRDSRGDDASHSDWIAIESTSLTEPKDTSLETARDSIPHPERARP